MKSGSLKTIIASLALLAGNAFALDYEGNMVPHIRTDQDAINAGDYTVRELFYRGAHLFTNRFTTVDALGEASDGPRRSKQALAGNPHTPFLRFNGLDAQSCMECHSAIGFRDFGMATLPREMGMIGGSAGFSANVFIFEEPDNLTEGIVRNPPHVNGLGYVQRLAEEMSFELFKIRDKAITDAEESGLTVRRELVAKGISFGYINVGPVGGIDTSEMEGVSEDFVIRPFQFKGIASTVRNFVAGALNFHFSIQPAELMRRFLIADDNPNGTLEGDIRDEILEGDITTITTFVSALRPPVSDTTGLDIDSVNQGRALLDAIGCTTCHVPSLRVDDPRITIIDPRLIDFLERRDPKNYRSIVKQPVEFNHAMTSQEADSKLLPVVLQYELEQGNSLVSEAREFFNQRAIPGRLPGLTYHLTREDFPPESMPRLPENSDRSVDVPLFSDLKRHDMGADLADQVEQETDVQSIRVRRREFVTRPLWGVADSGPWLHDGRATTLREAILMHAGDGSAANDAVDGFKELSEKNQESVVVFLKSLRVRSMKSEINPIPPQTQFIVY